MAAVKNIAGLEHELLLHPDALMKILRGPDIQAAKTSKRLGIVYGCQDTTMLDAEKLMHKHRIRHLPVIDGAKLVGMLSIRDVMVWRWQESRDEVNVLRDAIIAVRNR